MEKTNQKNTTAKAPVAKANGKAKGAPAEDSMLDEFFHDELKDIYWAEKHLVKTLPKMQKAATSEELQKAFTDHLSVTREHVSRLEQVFEMLGHKPQAKKCDAMEGITKEGESLAPKSVIQIPVERHSPLQTVMDVLMTVNTTRSYGMSNWML